MGSTPRRWPAILGPDDAEMAAVDYLGVHRCGPHILLTEQCVNRLDVGVRLDQVGREAVAEPLASGELGEPPQASGVVHGPLHCDHRPRHPAMGTNFATQGTFAVRDLVTGIRGYTASVYLRRCADSPRTIVTNLRKHEDIMRQLSSCSHKVRGTTPRFASR